MGLGNRVIDDVVDKLVLTDLFVMPNASFMSRTADHARQLASVRADHVHLSARLAQIDGNERPFSASVVTLSDVIPFVREDFIHPISVDISDSQAVSIAL